MNLSEIKEFLDEKVLLYNNPAFIDTDPVSVPHRFDRKEDIEIAAFLTAIISWGNRNTIIRNASGMMSLMGNSPFDFVLNHKEHHLDRFTGFVHRTFNHTDLAYCMSALRHICHTQGGMEKIFTVNASGKSILPAIVAFKKAFFELPHPQRTLRHIPDPGKGSVAKRINMFLRWMVRKDNHGVDFGIWKDIPPAILSCPLDVHSGNVARKLQLINRKQNDIRALAELDANLRLMDETDPVKYDFALFGLGVHEKF